MVDTHIQVSLTCDNCGTVIDYDDADSLAIEPAIEKALKELDWEQVEDIHLCPDCK